MDYDASLSSVGELGLWHCMVLVLLIPSALLPGMWSVLFVFSGYVAKHRCSVPFCDDESSRYSESWLNFSIPKEDEGWSSCNVYKQMNDSQPTCSADRFTTEYEDCTEFVFDTSLFTSTVVTEFSLVCDGEQGQVLVDLGYSMYSVGVFLGVLVPGFLSDRFGRKKMMFLAMAVSAISTLASAYVQDYTSFLVLRVFNGFGTLGTFVTMCILSVEITSQRYKSLVGNLVHILWAPGQMLLALLAFFIRDWRTLHIAVSIPIFASLLLYPLTPESPRWLIAVGKEKEAAKIIHQISRMHKCPLPPDSPTGPTPALPPNLTSPSQTEQRVSIRDLISSKGLALTTAILSLNWLVVDFCYYGLSLHSVNLAGDIFTNFVLSAAVEVPAVVLGMLGMDWIGRVSLLVICQLVGGAACILAGLLQPPAVLPLALLGKFASTIVFLTVYLYTAEIYPTSVRGMGLALTATMARIGGFLAPFIAGLGVKNTSLPFLIFGGAAILGGLAGVFLPETRGSALPDTVQDVEIIMKNRTFLKRFRNKESFELTEL
eukprot:GFUD01025341.1.p1 GENE.GFUD01025341.1~~GFUD01025341.1.p1  ORF type:complete len:544 (-),score=116.27 GFUD01025341.1:296-1927(-)